jgi:hypothetical protein
MMKLMDHETTNDRLQALLIDASTVTDHAEQLRTHAEDHASVLPQDFLHDLGVLVEELRDLRDDVHDIGLDPNDGAARPRRQRPDEDRPPARLEELPIKPDDEQH